MGKLIFCREIHVHRVAYPNNNTVRNKKTVPQIHITLAWKNPDLIKYQLVINNYFISNIHFFKSIGRLISIAIFLQCCLPEDCMSGSIISEVSLFLTSWNWTSFSSLYFISFNIETHTHSMEQMESVVKLLQICCYAAADFSATKYRWWWPSICLLLCHLTQYNSIFCVQLAKLEKIIHVSYSL